MKLGFFGGSFNPPTKAHLNLADKAIKECSLDKVIFVPMGDFYKKLGLAKGIDRFNMLKIACSAYENNKMQVSDLELREENKKIYAIDAFRLIEKEYPKDDKFFIMGADNFIKLTSWRNSEELINNYKYIVFERGNINLTKYINNNKDLMKCNINIIQNNEYKTDSSTEFREFLKNGKKQGIVQEEVLDYIIKNNIYKNF